MEFAISQEIRARIDAVHGQGCNCCQAVCAAFAEEFRVPQDEVLRLGAGFGGGMGYYGLTCGALAGAAMVFSSRYGSDFAGNAAYKREFYAAVKALAGAFEQRAGAATCTTLRKLRAEQQGLSCIELMYLAAELTTEFLDKYQDILHN